MNWCFQVVVLDKTLESPLDCKEVKAVNPKGNQPWIFIGRTDAEAPILWPPDVKSWLIGEDLMLGKTEGKRRRGRQRWDGWMASPTLPTWVWASSRRQWRTGKSGVLQSTGSQRDGHDWATEQHDWDKLGNLSQNINFKDKNKVTGRKTESRDQVKEWQMLLKK